MGSVSGNNGVVSSFWAHETPLGECNGEPLNGTWVGSPVDDDLSGADAFLASACSSPDGTPVNLSDIGRCAPSESEFLNLTLRAPKLTAPDDVIALPKRGAFPETPDWTVLSRMPMTVDTLMPNPGFTFVPSNRPPENVWADGLYVAKGRVSPVTQQLEATADSPAVLPGYGSLSAALRMACNLPVNLLGSANGVYVVRKPTTALSLTESCLQCPPDPVGLLGAAPDQVAMFIPTSASGTRCSVGKPKVNPVFAAQTSALSLK